MPIVVKETGGTFTPAPAGVHQGVCVDVVDLGVVEMTWQGKTKSAHKVRVIWEIDEELEQGKRFTVSKQYTASLNEKSNLRKDLQSWRGRPFTEKELAGFDLENLLGANAMLNVIQTQREGKTWANVQAIMPLPKNMQKIVGSLEYIRVKDRMPASGDARESEDDPSGYDPSDSEVPF